MVKYSVLAVLAPLLLLESSLGLLSEFARPHTVLQLQRHNTTMLAHQRALSRQLTRNFVSADSNPPQLAPIFPGYGTHYAFVYAGTPPQRQSVIIDTGSHFTAFPCTGCTTCGQHTGTVYHAALLCSWVFITLARFNDCALLLLRSILQPRCEYHFQYPAVQWKAMCVFAILCRGELMACIQGDRQAMDRAGEF